jgi:hypothetical protein
MLGLAVAAVAVVGIGLALKNTGGPDRAIERAESALEPDPRSQVVPTPTPTPAPSPAASVVSDAQAEPPASDETEAAANDSDRAVPSSSAAADAATDSGASDTAAGAGDMLKVKINIYPDDAEIYHKGKLVGRGGAEVLVEKGERKLLVLIRDGYYPRKLILDGKETKYNIGLRKQPAASFLAGPTSAKAQKATGGTDAPAPTPPAAAADKPLTPPTP